MRAATPSSRVFLDMERALQFDARLQLGRSLSLFGVAGFLDTQLGYRSQGQNGDELRADITLGLRLVPRLLLLAQSFSTASLRATQSGYIASQKLQLSAVYDISERLAFQIGVVDALAGMNSPAEMGVTSGLWLRY